MPTASSTRTNESSREKESGWTRRILPGLALLLQYKREWLLKDICAGLVLTTLLVPVGMGYASAAGLPPINGLYATIAPLVLYALFGSSRILVLGPDSSLAAIIAATVFPLSGGDSQRAVELASMLAILSGSFCIVAGLLKFGFITDLLSNPIRCGYLNAIALTVLVGQLPKLLGFKVGGHDLIEESKGLLNGILDGRINRVAFSIGLSCLIIIIGLKFMAPKIPGVLIAMIGATIVVSILDPTAFNISVVGDLPQGLPSLHIPQVSMEQMTSLMAGAAAIAVVSFADMSVVSRKFAMSDSHDLDDNKELIALGAANAAAGLLQGFSVTSSSSRTPVAEAAGAKSQVTCLVGAGCIALLLQFAPQLFQNIPTPALAAVVISACISLLEIGSVWRLYKLRSIELVYSVICFLGVALVGILQGILIATAVALLNFIRKAWQPYTATLGRVYGLKGYHDISRHPDARLIPGLVLFRWDAPLFFANARIFQERIMKAIEQSPQPVKWVVVAAEPVTDIDITAADSLKELDDDLSKVGIELCFAEMKGPVKDQLKRYGLFGKFGKEHFFRTIGKAVDQYIEENNVNWKDWDE